MQEKTRKAIFPDSPGFLTRKEALLGNKMAFSMFQTGANQGTKGLWQHRTILSTVSLAHFP
ncbi:hypothetical protein [Acutalibacter intestini]|uniref:hypothetical protein n=1 Tax=Acutalibacter intestini TaxID=3093659 RepID=UPI002AC8A93B|nr:hypothetical protein [Acutalibacter sp. M00204]